MDPFTAQLERLCGAHPTRAKWVFVPSHAVGRTLGDRTVLEGTDWANLRFVTPLDVALRMGAPFLVERGINPSEEGLGPALMMRLLLGLPPGSRYFRRLANQPQMAMALWSTIRELRMAGVRAADLRADAFVSADKHVEFLALLESYERYLSDNQRGDMAVVFEEALRHADWCPIQPADCWTELPDVIWPPLHRRLIDAMPGERVVPDVLELPGTTRPRRLAAARVSRVVPDPSAPLAFLMAPERLMESSGQPGGLKSAPASAGSPRQLSFLEPSAQSPVPHFFSAGGAEAEIEEVFRRILSSGQSLDRSEIVCAAPAYVALIWEKAMRYEWPITLAQGIAAALTRPGRALMALTDWIEDDFAAGRLRRLLQSGDVALPKEMSLSSGRAAGLLVTSQAAWGRHTYRLALARLAKSSRTGAQRDDRPADERAALEARATQAEELASWIEALIADIPEQEPDGQVDLQKVVECARTFVETCAARGSALDAMAAAALAEAIGGLRALGSYRCPLDQALRFLRERVETLHVGADRPRPGHLYVSSLTAAGMAARPYIYVVGLEEGRVFPAPFEDPVLLDSERAKISPALASSSDRIDEAVYAALGRLAAMSSQSGVAMTLSYSCRDLREYRQTYASWLLLQAHRLVSGNPRATYQHLHEHLGEPRSCVPAGPTDALSESRWWLNGVLRAGNRSRQAVMERYPPLAAGAIALEARRSDRFTEFDGHVPAAGAALDPCANGLVISPTQLEKAADCPYRHFLERGLGIGAIESGDRDRDVWLDHLLRGSLLHDLYAALLRRCRAEGRRAKSPEDRGWLVARGQQMLAELAIEMPPPSDEVRERETRVFLDDLMLFADEESSLDPSRTPVGFEVSFGRADTVDGEALAQAEPVVVKLARDLELRLAGRIDRIDRVGPSTYEIIDYKSGSYYEPRWRGTFAGGTRLQHALYGLAAVVLLKRQDQKARVAGSEYYFPSARGQQEHRRFAALSTAAIAEVLADLRNVISNGLFVHTSHDDSCRFCLYGHSCGKDATARAAEKLADPKLAPYGKLAAHD